MFKPRPSVLMGAIAFSAVICAQAQPIAGKESAVNGQIADVSTTAAGLLMGASEANPLGLATLGLKYIVYQHIQDAPLDRQPQLWQQYGAVGWGAAANNVCVLVGIVTGGAGALACPLLGLGVGAAMMTQSLPPSPVALERQVFMDFCQDQRSRQPDLQCIYVPSRG